MKNCKESIKLHYYVDGQLSSADQRFMADHVAGCTSCTHALKEFEAANKIISMTGQEKPILANPVVFTDSVLANIKPRRKPFSFPYLTFEWFKMAASFQGTLRVGFGMATLALLGLFAYQQTIINEKVERLEQTMSIDEMPVSYPSSHKISFGGQAKLISIIGRDQWQKLVPTGAIAKKDLPQLLQRIEAWQIEKEEILKLLESDPELGKSVKQILEKKEKSLMQEGQHENEL